MHNKDVVEFMFKRVSLYSRLSIQNVKRYMLTTLGYDVYTNSKITLPFPTIQEKHYQLVSNIFRFMLTNQTKYIYDAMSLRTRRQIINNYLSALAYRFNLKSIEITFRDGMENNLQSTCGNSFIMPTDVRRNNSVALAIKMIPYSTTQHEKISKVITDISTLELMQRYLRNPYKYQYKPSLKEECERRVLEKKVFKMFNTILSDLFELLGMRAALRNITLILQNNNWVYLSAVYSSKEDK